MAHRIVTQIVLVGGRVLGRAFAEAWRQASASSKYAAQQARAAPGSEQARTFAASGMSLDEAQKILNVRAPAPAPPGGGGSGGSGRGQAAAADMEPVLERFKRLFDANDPKQGGSFYLQSKIVRARERIELEVREAELAAARQAEHQRNPMYRPGGPARPARERPPGPST